MKSTKHLALLLILTAGLALGACIPDDAGGTGTGANTSAEPATSELESALTCTPGQEMCDYGCYYVGGPSTDDCIVRCNSTGTAWVKIQSCGWAQNWPYSSSCRDTTPHPVCEWN